MVDYPNITIVEIKPDVFLAKHKNGNNLKFRTSKESFITSKTVKSKLDYFNKYGLMVGYGK